MESKPRQPPLIEPDLKFSFIRLSDGVHGAAVAAVPYRIVPERKCKPMPLNEA
jgi:hypothetical protein